MDAKSGISMVSWRKGGIVGGWMDAWKERFVGVMGRVGVDRWMKGRARTDGWWTERKMSRVIGVRGGWVGGWMDGCMRG
jgi:hypothetical protein